MFNPKKIVKLAQPGEVQGYGRLIKRDELDGDYAEAASLAYLNRGHPVIVHEFDVPQHQVDQVDQEAGEEVTKADVEQQVKELGLYVQTEVRITIGLLNEADQANVLPRPDDVLTCPPDLERFQVSQSTVEAKMRTFVVFHPNGRPKRARKTKNDEAAAADEPERVTGVAPAGPGPDEEPF